MITETAEPQVIEITLRELLGTFSSTVFLLLVVIVLGLFIATIIARAKRRQPERYGWWLRMVSGWSLIFGIMVWSHRIFVYQAKSSLGGMASGEHAARIFAQANGRLTAAAFIALAAWTLSLAAGAKQK